MGYHGNGFVFTAEPEWQATARALPDFIAMRAYKHKEQPIWFLDAWKHSTRHHLPFAGELPDKLELEGELPPNTTAVLETYRQIVKALPSAEVSYGLGLLRSVAHVSLASAVPIFFFAADDEGTDMAVCAEAGHFTKFCVRTGIGAIEFAMGKLIFVPFEYMEDPDLTPSTQELASLAQIAGLAVAPAQPIESGLPLYGSAVRLWPSGDPAKLLGIGTWDPFMNVDRTLEIVFERMPMSVPSHTSKKKWWQF